MERERRAEAQGYRRVAARGGGQRGVGKIRRGSKSLSYFLAVTAG